MTKEIAELIVTGLGLYGAIGLVFSILFVSLGLGRVDPNAKATSWAVKLILIPASIALWPVLAVKWLGAAFRPAEEG